MNFMSFLSSGHSRNLFPRRSCQLQPQWDLKNFQYTLQKFRKSSFQSRRSKKFSIIIEQFYSYLHILFLTSEPQEKSKEKESKEPIIPIVIQPKQKIIQQMLINQQKQLINQYLQLNLQLMTQKVECNQQTQKNKTESEKQEQDVKSLKKKIKKMNHCGHDDKQHYAKGMCNNCYHKYGRNKKPWNCKHEKLYASGLCQNCYINKYNKDKRLKQSTFQRSQDKQVEMGIDGQSN